MSGTTGSSGAGGRTWSAAVRRAAAVVVGAPLVAAVAGAALVRSWRDELPAEVAVHWGVGGRADGFASPDRALLLGGVGAVAGIVVGGVGLALTRGRGSGARAAAGLSAGVSTFVVGVSVASLAGQRGLVDAAAAPAPDLSLVLAGAVAVLAGLVASRLVPGRDAAAARATTAPPVEAPRLGLRPGERAVWSGWSHLGAGGATAIGGAATVLAALVVLGVAPAFVLVVLGLVLLLAVGLGSVRATVDPRGLAVRPALGVPVLRVPLAEVAEAHVVEVHPLRDFGGWGYRIGRDGSTGVVLRSGAALEVRRGDGTRVVVTVDDPATGAALLNTLAARAHA